MKRLLKEPLVHFLLLGAALFAAFALMQEPGARGDASEIVVTVGQVENLAATFEKAWQRPPTPRELAGLVQDRVREEVYYREAKALGLDEDDTVIRRRLRQKMEFISDDIAAQAEPTEAELTAYLETHGESFRIEPRFTFRQVYLDPLKHDDRLERDARQLLARLNDAGDAADLTDLGDPLMLEQRFTSVSAGAVARQFGGIFAERLADVTPGRWHGPIESGYGMHLVQVGEREEGRLPALAEVREAVQREWANARRLEANEEFYRNLLRRYTVTIDGLDSADGPDRLATTSAR